MKTRLTLILTICVYGCASEKPYEKQIIEVFETRFKIVPIIEEIKIDSSTNMQMFSDYWKNKAEQHKVTIKNSTEEIYSSLKENHELGKKYGSDAKPDEMMISFKRKLDSLQKVFSTKTCLLD